MAEMIIVRKDNLKEILKDIAVKKCICPKPIGRVYLQLNGRGHSIVVNAFDNNVFLTINPSGRQVCYKGTFFIRPDMNEIVFWSEIIRQAVKYDSSFNGFCLKDMVVDGLKNGGPCRQKRLMEKAQDAIDGISYAEDNADLIKDADTVLADIVAKGLVDADLICNNGIGADILDTFLTSKDKSSIMKMFELLTGVEFVDYLDQCVDLQLHNS